MPFDFLGLPRELRDQIYGYAHLLPSTPYYIQVERIPRLQPPKGKPPKPSKDSRSPTQIKPYQPAPANKPSFRLQLIINPLPRAPPYGLETTPTPIYFTLSLLRVNRQIHAEIGHRFWQHAILSFPSYLPSDLGMIPGVTEAFKGMGQTSSRLVRHIRIHMGGSEHKPGTSFPKVLQHIRSRARYGALKKVEMVWDYRRLPSLRYGSWFDGFLEALRGSSDCGYERVIRIVGMRSFDIMDVRHRENILMAIRDLHFACGGKVYWEEDLIWENYEIMGTPDI